MSEVGGEMTGHRRRDPRSAVPATPLDNDDTLALILLRLPPLPSSLPRAAAVCKRWRRVVSDRHFLRGFLAHHRKPPLLGFFSSQFRGMLEFRSAMDPPASIPDGHFSLELGESLTSKVVHDCRHGRVLVQKNRQQHFLVWDPITGDQHRVAFPPSFNEKRISVVHGAVICAAGGEGHVHGACYSDPFQVVLVGEIRGQIFACIYSSETGISGNVLSVMTPPDIMTVTVLRNSPSAMVGNSVYWVLTGTRAAILEFDLHRQNLAVFDVAADAFDFRAFLFRACQLLITPADGGGLNFIVLAGFTVSVWKRTSNGDWMPRRAIELSDLLSLGPSDNRDPVMILGHNQDANVIFKSCDRGEVFMVHIESLQFKKLSNEMGYGLYHPFSSFYPGGT